MFNIVHFHLTMMNDLVMTTKEDINPISEISKKHLSISSYTDMKKIENYLFKNAAHKV